jgi:hypothetical protein
MYTYHINYNYIYIIYIYDLRGFGYKISLQQPCKTNTRERHATSPVQEVGSDIWGHTNLVIQNRHGKWMNMTQLIPVVDDSPIRHGVFP